MPRDSSSSLRERGRPELDHNNDNNEPSSRRHEDYRRSRARDEGDPRRHHGRGDRDRTDWVRRDEGQRDHDNRYRGGYGERDRERERQRDRDRYDRDRHRESRRSASPRRSRSVADDSPSGGDKNKGKPNFASSGLLAAETNTVTASNGDSTVLKYNEPPEARRPLLGWRLYVFKGEEQTDLLHIHKQSAYLIGRDRLVADIAIEHPSCSKQHAAIQYRFVHEEDEFGGSKGVIKPYVIDLESTNGTHVNGITIPASRFYELKPGDVIKFGTSTREYVLLHDEAT